MAAEDAVVTLQAVGDVKVNRDHPESAFTHVAPTFHQSDILFGNCESPSSDKGSPNPISSSYRREPPRNLVALKFAGFHVMSFANNHCLDWGYDAFFDTLERLRKINILPVGAGNDIDEARKPVIIERKGTRVAFLAYASATFLGYAADEQKPGCAPIRVYTHYHQVEHEQPGTDPEIFTFPDPDDLEAMRQDVQKARSSADVVVVSEHWGLHFVPFKLARYESEVAKVAIDAGADLILGHHQHILKAIEVYKGKAIFHSLGNFVIDAASALKAEKKPGIRRMMKRYADRVGIWPDCPLYPLHPDSRKTVVVKCLIRNKRIEKVSFIPCLINAQNSPEVLTRDNKDFDEGVQYLEEITKKADIDTKFIVEGDEVVVSL